MSIEDARSAHLDAIGVGAGVLGRGESFGPRVRQAPSRVRYFAACHVEMPVLPGGEV